MKTQFLKTAAFAALLSLSTQANAAKDVCYGADCNQKGLQANAGVTFTKFNPKCVQFAQLMNKVADLANKIGFDVENDDYSRIKDYSTLQPIQKDAVKLLNFFEEIKKSMVGIHTLESCGADFRLLSHITFRIRFLNELLEAKLSSLLYPRSFNVLNHHSFNDIRKDQISTLEILKSWLNGDM